MSAGALGVAVVLTGAVALASVITESYSSDTERSSTASAGASSRVAASPSGAGPSGGSPSSAAPSATPSPTATRAPRPRPTPTKRTVPPLQPSAAVTVYNNSTITGLAARSAVRVRNVGFTVVHVGNVYGRVDRTTVYYRPGYRAQADLLAVRLRGLQAVRPAPDWLPGNSPLIFVVTRDFAE